MTVFGSRREGWRPDRPDAYAEPFIPVLWVRVLELLGRVPKGSTGKFLEDGSLTRLTDPSALRHLRRCG